MKTGAPVIGLVDCAGIRLQEATDALEAFGQIYLKQTLASGVIPQITAIFGTCGGGMAVIPSLTDFTFMESKKEKCSSTHQTHWKETTQTNATQQQLISRAKRQV